MRTCRICGHEGPEQEFVVGKKNLCRECASHKSPGLTHYVPTDERAWSEQAIAEYARAALGVYRILGRHNGGTNQ